MSGDRTNNGTFAPGNPGGPGRPRRSVEKEYIDAVVGVVSVAEWTIVVQKALDDAKDGDDKARTWLGKLLVGSDPAAVVGMAEELAELRKLMEEIQNAHR